MSGVLELGLDWECGSRSSSFDLRTHPHLTEAVRSFGAVATVELAQSSDVRFVYTYPIAGSIVLAGGRL